MLHSREPGERSSIDDIIALYKKDVDRSLLREALKLTPEERLQQLQDLVDFVDELRRAARKTFG